MHFKKPVNNLCNLQWHNYEQPAIALSYDYSAKTVTHEYLDSPQFEYKRGSVSE
jgi:hypothetical protein